MRAAFQSCSTPGCRRRARLPYRHCYGCFIDHERAAAYSEGFRRGHDEGLSLGRAQGEQTTFARLKTEQRQAERLRPIGNVHLDELTWRRLVLLSHPDRHAGSAAAVTAMTWLNSIRTRVSA